MTEFDIAPWDILGISEDADTRTLKRAYARKLKEYHPEDDPEGFQRIRAAYEWMQDAVNQNEEIPLWRDPKTVDFASHDSGPKASTTTAKEGPHATPAPPAENDPKIQEVVTHSTAKTQGLATFREFQSTLEQKGTQAAIAYLSETLQNEPFGTHPDALLQFYILLFPFLEAQPVIPKELAVFLIETLFLEFHLETLGNQYPPERLWSFRHKLRNGWIQSMEARLHQAWQIFLREITQTKSKNPIRNLLHAVEEQVEKRPKLEKILVAYLFREIGKVDLPAEVVMALNSAFHFHTHFKAGHFAHLDEEDILKSIDLLEKSFIGLNTAAVEKSPKFVRLHLMRQKFRETFLLIFVPVFCLSSVIVPFFSHTFFNHPKVSPSKSLDNSVKTGAAKSQTPIVGPQVHPLSPFFHDAIETQQHEVLSQLWDQHAHACTVWNAQESSLLHYCILVKNPTALEILLQKGVDPNQFNASGFGPLHLAVAKNQRESLTLLLEYGANPHKVHESNSTSAIEFAKRLEEKELVRLLEARQQ